MTGAGTGPWANRGPSPGSKMEAQGYTVQGRRCQPQGTPSTKRDGSGDLLRAWSEGCDTSRCGKTQRRTGEGRTAVVLAGSRTHRTCEFILLFFR